MDTIITERNGRLFLTGGVRIVRDLSDIPEDIASGGDWDIDRSNPFIKWLSGDFVEADNANSNTQFWTKDDLAMNEYTIKYAPLNMLHKQTTPVGFFLSSRMVSFGDDAELHKPKKGKHRFVPHQVVNKVYETYGPGMCVACGQPSSDPDHDGDTDAPGQPDTDAAAANTPQGTAKIEALAGMWSHVFPWEAALVDQADELGQLFFSMECRGTHLHCAGPNGCDKEFAYSDTDNHCAHLKERSSIRHIVNPTFRGGALIIPPTRPGWNGARVGVYEDALRDEASRYAEMTQDIYEQALLGGSDLSVSAWEHLMAEVLMLAEA